MQPHLSRLEAGPSPISRGGARRKNARFGMTFSVLLRTIGDPWMSSQTANLSATGTFIFTDRPFLLNTPIEYVLTFPPDLTKASQPLFVRFFGMVLRCERGEGDQFGIAIRNTAHRYLTHEEAAGFDAMLTRFSMTMTPAEPNESLI